MKKICGLICLLAMVLCVSCQLRGIPSDTVVESGTTAPETYSPAGTEPEPEETPGTESESEETPETEPEPEETPGSEPESEEIPETESEPALCPAEEAVDRMLASMTAEEKLGQMFLAAYAGDGTAEILRQYHFGGFILFAADFEHETPESIAEALGALQESAAYGLFFAVDEEGGTVTRISRFPQYRQTPFLSPRELYAAGGMERIRSDAAEKAALLRALGLNVNMAPVCDLSADPADFMYKRSPGGDAALTAEIAAAVLEETSAYGVGSVLKHFPGYGKAVDTHTGMAYDYRSYEETAGWDLVPFQAGIDSGAEFVMLSHIIASAVDPLKPASVSPKSAEMLRSMGFDGVIITDDLAMEGITDFTENGCAALDAILAGCDMVCCSNWKEQYPAVLAACGDGRITEARLDESVRRILRTKLALGILE